MNKLSIGLLITCAIRAHDAYAHLSDSDDSHHQHKPHHVASRKPGESHWEHFKEHFEDDESHHEKKPRHERLEGESHWEHFKENFTEDDSPKSHTVHKPHRIHHREPGESRLEHFAEHFDDNEPVMND